VDAGLDAPVERPTLEKLIARGTLDEVATANETYGYSLREIAQLVGISPATLSRRLRAGGGETLASGSDVSGRGATEP
jgi:AraC-like DNA-binding protein